MSTTLVKCSMGEGCLRSRYALPGKVKTSESCSDQGENRGLLTSASVWLGWDFFFFFSNVSVRYATIHVLRSARCSDMTMSYSSIRLT